MSQKNRLGGLWKKETKAGKPFLSGGITVEGRLVRIVIWPNERKNTAKSPDFSVYLDDWKPTGGGIGGGTNNAPAYPAEPDDMSGADDAAGLDIPF